MKKFIKIYYIVLIIFIIITLFSTIIFAAEVSIESENEENKLEDLQNQKKELETNIQESNNQIQLVETELSDLLIKVEELSLEIMQKNSEIDKLTIENKALDLNISEAQKELDKITNKYNRNKELLEKRLVAAYKNGKTSYLDILLRSKGLVSFISNYYLISEIIEADEELIKNIAKNKEEIEELNKTLVEKKSELEENKILMQKKKIALENIQALKKRRIEELSETEQNLYSQIEEYQNQIDDVKKEIMLLTLNNISSEYVGGIMAWPVPGYTRITSPFGMRTHPITGIYQLHTGTDIGAPIGATFIAANDGVVVKAEFNVAYGNMVILDHGGGVTTLYAHGSEILVQVGDTVVQGTPVLNVGSTGYSTGPHAHFEVRVNGEYKNPIDYITSYNTKIEEQKSEEVVLNN